MSFFLTLVLLLFFCQSAGAAVGFTAGAETGNDSEWCVPVTDGNCFYPNQIFASNAPGVARTGNFGFISTHANPLTGHDGKYDRNRFFGTLGIGAGDDRYYSAWYYIADGYDADTKFRNNMQWKGFPDGSCGGAAGVSWHMGFRRRSAGSANPEVTMTHQGCQEGAATCVNVAGDDPTTPAGIYRSAAPIPVPYATWFNVQLFFKPAQTNTGQIIVWQDGVQILNINNVNTIDTKCAPLNQVRWGVGNYVSEQAVGRQELRIDDVVVSDIFIEDPQQPTTVLTQSACRFESATGTEAAPTSTEGDSITLTAGECRRVRCAVDVTTATSDAANYGLHYSITGANGAYTAVPAACTTAAPCFNSANFPSLTHNQVTTDAGLSAPTFVAGKVQLNASVVAVGAIASGSGTELVAGVCTDANGAGTYHFRFRRNGLELNTHTVTPDFTLESPDVPPTPLTGGLSIGGGVSAGGTR